MIKNKVKGFALIEVSIALLVLGIISSISINQFLTVRRLQAEMTTQSNIDYVLKSLGVYYICTGGALPYPSRNGTVITGIQYMGNNDFGIVPYRTIGIMAKYAKDGYGNWLLYKRNPEFGHVVDAYYLNKNMGITEFASDIPNDKVAIIIKYSSSNSNNNEHYTWVSENNFIQLFANGKVKRGITRPEPAL